MDLLFKTKEGYTYPSIDGSDYTYRSWKTDDQWHEVLEVLGKPSLAPGEGFRQVLKSPVLVTLYDKECHIWKYLELRGRGSYASGMRSLVTVLATFICAIVFSQLLSYVLGGYEILTWTWYIRYPIFGIVAIVLTVVGFISHDKMKHEFKLRKAARFIKGLPKITNRSASYYKEVVIKMIDCQDKERSKTAKTLIERNLV